MDKTPRMRGLCEEYIAAASGSTLDWGSLNDHLREGWYYYYTGNDCGSHECGLFSAHTDNVTHGSYAGSLLITLSSRIR